MERVHLAREGREPAGPGPTNLGDIGRGNATGRRDARGIPGVAQRERILRLAGDVEGQQVARIELAFDGLAVYFLVDLRGRLDAVLAGTGRVRKRGRLRLHGRDERERPQREDGDANEHGSGLEG